MILDTNNNQEHDLYVKALKSLNKHNAVSEYTKVPETREETQFMKETNKACSKTSISMNIPEDRYIRIFKQEKQSDEMA